MKARKRDLMGRRIVGVDFRRFATEVAGMPRTQAAAWTTDPVLVLDNGRRIWFAVDETETGEYGICICITDPKPRQGGAQ